MTTINVSASKWITTLGFIYTTDLDPMEISNVDALEEMAKAYAADFAAENKLSDGEDMKLIFTAENGGASFETWVSEI